MTRVELADALPRAAEIVADVRARGDAAVLDWTERLDGARPESIRVPTERIAAARVDDDLLRAIRAMADAVRAVHAAQRPVPVVVETAPGIRVERRHLPVESVGVYAPGGRHPYPSSLVMAAVPARVAGVERIAVCSPTPGEAILATARELGIDEVYGVGGAQAVAALAYGTESVPAVDKIVGPGNRWVTAAKLVVSANVGIDLPAGPSEVLVIADGTADPALVAADLISQAEHGPDSACLLVTTSAEVGDAVRALVADWEQVAIEVVETLDEAVARANGYAPEHLELHVADPEAASRGVRNAGTVFLGAATPTSLGDYAAGSNHVLPTGGLARGAGGLGLDAFLKPVQFVTATLEGLATVRETVGTIAAAEGLPLHAAAIEARFGGSDAPA